MTLLRAERMVWWRADCVTKPFPKEDKRGSRPNVMYKAHLVRGRANQGSDWAKLAQ